MPAMLLAAAGVTIGFVSLLLAGAGANRQPLAAAAMPWIASGGLGGVAIIGWSATLMAVTRRRRTLAREVVLLDEATELARMLGARG